MQTKRARVEQERAPGPSEGTVQEQAEAGQPATNQGTNLKARQDRTPETRKWVNSRPKQYSAHKVAWLFHRKEVIFPDRAGTNT